MMHFSLRTGMPALPISGLSTLFPDPSGLRKRVFLLMYEIGGCGESPQRMFTSVFESILRGLEC